MDRSEQHVVATDRVRPRRGVRRLRAAAVVLVVVLVVVTLWWQSDGQQRRRAVAGLGDLPGVTSATTSDRDRRQVRVRVGAAATARQVALVLQHAGRVAADDRYPVIDVMVAVGSAYTRLDGALPGRAASGGEVAARARLLRVLSRLRPGSAYVASEDQVFLRRTGNPSSPRTGSLDQVLAALRLLDRAGRPVPDGLSGYGQLDLTGVDVGPAELGRALTRLRPLVEAGLRPELVRGDLVNVSIDQDLPPARVRALLDAASRQLSAARSHGRPVLGRLYAEYPDRRRDGIGVTVR